MRGFRLAIVLAVLALCISSAAFAKTPSVVYTWNMDDTNCGTWGMSNVYDPLLGDYVDMCTWDRCAEASYVDLAPGGDEVEQVIEPLGTRLDPRVRQTVVNNTESDIWTDWHVRITNGKNLRGMIVYKVGTPNLSWVIDPMLTWPNGDLGFFAHVVTTGDPNNPMAVRPNDQLYVEFIYDVNVSGTPVTIEQYPTNDYAIPEPSSILALMAGMGSFGLLIRRKK